MVKFSKLNDLSDKEARVYHCEPPERTFPGRDLNINSRLRLAMEQESLDLIHKSSVTVVGCGTVGGPVALVMAKKGYASSGGRIILCDFDKVGLENLPTQFFKLSQIGTPKVFALAEILTEQVPYFTEIVALNMSWERALENVPELIDEQNITIATVDSGLWRAKISQYVHEKGVYVTGGLSLNTTFGWVMYHTPQMKNFVQLLPEKSSGVSQGCAGVIADASLTIAGMISYVADCGLFQHNNHNEPNRILKWQFRRVFLDGFWEDEYIRRENG